MKNVYLFFLINIVCFFLINVSYAFDLPYWIVSPKHDGYEFCVTGSALENGSKVAQKQVARINAMAELSKIQTVSINNQLDIEQYTIKSGDSLLDSSKNISSKSNQYSNSVINKAEEIDTYFDNKTGVFYILMCIK